MLSKQAISSNLAIAALLILLAFLGRSKFKQLRDQNEINRQKATLQAQADAQQKKNDELNQSLSYLNSSDFKEKVARDQLGLKKQGEQVYTFANAPAPAPPAQPPAGSNFKKWLAYFFSDNQ